jgi:hypothetical protein
MSQQPGPGGDGREVTYRGSAAHPQPPDTPISDDARHEQRLIVNAERIEALERLLSARMHNSDAVIADYQRRISALEDEIGRISAAGALSRLAGHTASGRRPILRVIRGGRSSGPTIIEFDLGAVAGWLHRLRGRLRFNLAQAESRS